MTAAPPAPLRVRSYGKSGPPLVLLHGGPGAPGYMAPLGRELAGEFRLLEPWQRAAGGAPLTVARHLADLDEVIRRSFPNEHPALVGSSWGAMLALCYAAAHPHRSGPLILIGCGTFDPAARERMREIVDQRMSPDLRCRIDRLDAEIPDPDRRLQAIGDLLLPLYSHDPITSDLEVAECDARGNAESWDDMQRLQAEGVYPAAFRAIKAPVLMLHGAQDPHPGEMIRDTLQAYLPHLEYRQWPDCGHYPWLERGVRDDFFATLRAWLGDHCAAR